MLRDSRKKAVGAWMYQIIVIPIHDGMCKSSGNEDFLIAKCFRAREYTEMIFSSVRRIYWEELFHKYSNDG